MSRNAEAITIFCSHLCMAEGILPFEPKEWGNLAARLMTLNYQPGDLLDFSLQDFQGILACTEDEASRMMRLIDRSASLRFELEKYESMGIQVITRADAEYPKQLKKKLGNACPPLFYAAGDPALLSRDCVGYVGSRDVAPSDIEFTRKTVAATAGKGYAVVSGGAKGIDSISASSAMAEGVAVIEYLSDSMQRKMRDSGLVQEIRDGRVLLMSVVVPTAGFNVGVAMMRNRYIYAQSSGTVIIRSDKGKGGTWTGATENIMHAWCPTFCRDCEYPGNQELIKLGAIPVTDDWDGDVSKYHTEPVKPVEPVRKPEQISMLDVL